MRATIHVSRNCEELKVSRHCLRRIMSRKTVTENHGVRIEIITFIGYWRLLANPNILLSCLEIKSHIPIKYKYKRQTTQGKMISVLLISD